MTSYSLSGTLIGYTLSGMRQAAITLGMLPLRTDVALVW